jgi:hypothetical protein
MKYYYRYSIMFLLIGLAAAFYVFNKNTKTARPASAAGKIEKTPLLNKAKPDVVPEATLSKIQQGLAEREYHITFDAQKASLQSPNRKQNLRAYYKPGVLTVQNRKDSAGHNFKIKLVTEGIYADGLKIHNPQPDASLENNESKLDIKHAGFTEQYINNQEGIRQNFLIQSAPKGTKELQVQLSVNGLKVNDVGGNELHFYNENRKGDIEKQLVYKDLKCWDATGKELVASLSYQDQKVLISVNALNAVYPVTIDPIVANGNPGNANSTAESNQAGANAGYSVSSAGDVNGDGYSDVLVGAPFYDKGETNEGAVLVYHGSATGIGANPVLILESNQSESRFGHSVSTAGDVNKDGFSDVVVGAPYYDKGQTNEGAAFVYHGSVNGLAGNAVTVMESNQLEAHFGNSAALAGDVNADGYSDLIIGAPWYDKGQTDEGAAFVYHGSAAGVVVNAKITIESNQVAAKMGNAVAGAGDVNGDGYSDVIVGSFWYDKGQNNEGAAFIYHGSALGINGNVVSTMESNQADASLGFSVASAGDVNGDGYSDVIVGAYLYDNGQSNEGAAFVYQGSAAGISTNASVVLESNQADAQAGYSVASAGDVNGDGFSDVIVGVSSFDKGQINEGAAFVYQGSSLGINPIVTSTLESDQANGGMGSAVASAGDVNGDGYSDIVVGASLFDKGQVDEGVAFVWFGSSSGFLNSAKTVLQGNVTSAHLGWSVANAGDVNGDGFDDVVVGADRFDNGIIEMNLAAIFHGSSTGTKTTPAVIIKDVMDGAYISGSVSGAGDVNGDGYDDIILANAYLNSEGVALVYHGSAQGIVPVVKATLKSDQAGLRMGACAKSAGDVNGDGYDDVIVGAAGSGVYVFHGSSIGVKTAHAFKVNVPGYSVSGAGDINGDGYDDIIIGSPVANNGQDQEGVAYIYHGSFNGLKSIATSTIKSNKTGARMGQSVACAGDINGDGFDDVILGAPFYSNGEYNEGAVYVFKGSAAGIKANPVIIESNVASSYMGNSVASAGDINGDNFSDVIIGMYRYTQGEEQEGAVMILSGSASGVSNTKLAFLESNQIQAYLGISVSGAGDVNADGYSDIIVGANYSDYGQKDEGTALIYHGSPTGNLNGLRVYDSNSAADLNQNHNFGLGLFAKSFLGRTKGKLIWETKPKGGRFFRNENNATDNARSIGSQNSYACLSLLGRELNSDITEQNAYTKVRVRVKYDPSTALTGQTYGPWRYLPAYLTGSSIAPVPENAMAETVKRKVEVLGKENFAESISIYPNPVSDKLFIDSKNPENIEGLQLMTTAGKSVYKLSGGDSTMDVRSLESGVYILIVTHTDGSQVPRKVVIRR